jgi:hypothetical protein
MHRRSTKNRVRAFAATTLGLVALVATALSANAQGGPGINPDGGILPKQPTRLCGRTIYETTREVWEKTYFNIYNGAGTCMTVDGRLDMTDIVVKTGTPVGWQYPNISSGWEWDRNPCNGHSGQCFAYPTPLATILSHYHPRSGMDATIGHGPYNLSWDIWFDPTPREKGQDTGTELMIWLAHPGIGVGGGRTWYTWIDGLEWEVNYWRPDHNGVSWNYVRYVLLSPKPRGVGGLWLNPFFENAIANGVLDRRDYLTSIDAGFEMPVWGDASNAAHGMGITSYALGGLPIGR